MRARVFVCRDVAHFQKLQREPLASQGNPVENALPMPMHTVVASQVREQCKNACEFKWQPRHLQMQFSCRADSLMLHVLVMPAFAVAARVVTVLGVHAGTCLWRHVACVWCSC